MRQDLSLFDAPFFKVSPNEAKVVLTLDARPGSS